MIQHPIVLTAKVLWSQIDSNNHLRHSAYADFGAQARVEAFNNIDINLERLHELAIGPILFKEELLYRREILPNDTIKVSCELAYLKKRATKWGFQQFIYRGDGILAAEINVEGAWLNLTTRKLTIPPAEIIDALLNKMPKSPNFLGDE